MRREPDLIELLFEIKRIDAEFRAGQSASEAAIALRNSLNRLAPGLVPQIEEESYGWLEHTILNKIKTIPHTQAAIEMGILRGTLIMGDDL